MEPIGCQAFYKQVGNGFKMSSVGADGWTGYLTAKDLRETIGYNIDTSQSADFAKFVKNAYYSNGPDKDTINK